MHFWGGLGGWLAAHLGEAVRLGLRIQGVLWLPQSPILCTDGFSCPVASADPDFQASLLPFLRVDFPPRHLELRFHLNLDEPHGPTLAGADQVWAVALRGGASWEP